MSLEYILPRFDGFDQAIYPCLAPTINIRNSQQSGAAAPPVTPMKSGS